MTRTIIGIVGGPCTGKTTLTQFLNNTLKDLGVQVALADEFASRDIVKNGVPDFTYAPFEQFRFALQQRRLEDECLRDASLVIAESPGFVAFLYAKLEKRAKKIPRAHLFLDDLETLFAEARHRYHRIYLLNREAGFEDNGVRFHSEAESLAFDWLLRESLEKHQVNFTFLHGTVLARAQHILQDLVGDGIIAQSVLDHFKAKVKDPLTGDKIAV